MRLALKATCITTLATLLASQAQADVTVSTATTAPLNTATSGNITIDAAGTIAPTASGAAVTINSSNNVTNSGKISLVGLSNSTGIAASGGFTGNITNSGTISVDENYTRTDTNADTVLDGPFAQGTNRFGIRIDGTAPFTGTINSTGAITVDGNNSGGIFIAAPLVGNFTTNTGAITVTGDNSTGISLGAVTGKVALSGGVTVLGGNSTGVSLNGPISGQAVVHSTISATGYSATTLPTDITKLTAQNLLQGGSALVINGSVGGGVLIAAAPADTTNTTADVDADGIADATQSTASIVTYGAAPSLVIGSGGNAVTFGTFTGNTNGLIINGNVAGVGVYSGISATGAQIGGYGTPVTINGGIAVAGQLAASSNGAKATALHIGAGATTPALTVSGSIGAGATATAGGTSVGIQIDAGARLPTITNSGQILATTTAAAGLSTAILDQSGTLASVTNSGRIIATSTDGTQRAIDVSGNTTGFTYTQALASSTQTTVPATGGAIVTGSGNDAVNISAGVIQSRINLGAGNDTIALSGTTVASVDAVLGDGNDNLSLSGTASMSGSVDFGSGTNTMTIGTGSSFFGQFVGMNNVAVALNGGTLGFNTVTQPNSTLNSNNITSLAVAGGTIGVIVDPSTGAHSTINVSGATTISAPTTLAVAVTKFGETAGSLNILTSGTLTGSSNLTLSIAALPYLLKGTLAASDTAGTIGVAIQRKSATELGFRRSEAAAYPAVFTAIQGNTTLSNLFLGLTERDPTLLRYREMLPDHSGGVFDVLTQGMRSLAPTEAATPWAQLGRVSLWAQQGIWDAHQDGTDTTGNGGSGWGLTGGGDVAIGGNSRVGISIGYIHGTIRNSGSAEVDANQFGGGVHWLSDWGNLHVAAYGTAGYVRLREQRALTGTTDTDPAILTSKSRWNGINAAAGAKASYDYTSGILYLRPSAQLTYNRLSEQSHDGSGGGVGFDLSVDKRTSSEFAATGLLAAGLRFGDQTDPDATTVRFELEGGRRQILSSNLDGTTAHFSGGQDFTLLPEDRKSGWIGGANASVGSASFRFIAGGQYETRSNGQRILSGRVGFRGSF